MNDYKSQSILYYLPNALKRGENSLILSNVTTLNKTLETHFNFWQDFDTDPMTCEESVLDWMATLGISPWRNYWQPDWQLETKRLLMRDTKKIFQRRLFPETISLLFTHFKLASVLVPKYGFVLGKTLLPATLGNSILDYQIELPTVYRGRIEEKYTQFIVNNFGMPGYVPFVYV